MPAEVARGGAALSRNAINEYGPIAGKMRRSRCRKERPVTRNSKTIIQDNTKNLVPLILPLIIIEFHSREEGEICLCTCIISHVICYVSHVK